MDLKQQLQDELAQRQQSERDRQALKEREQELLEQVQVLENQRDICIQELRQQEEVRKEIARLAAPRDLGFLAQFKH